MSTKEFLQEAREDYEGSSLAYLERSAKDYLSYLTKRELESDEYTHEDLRTLLALYLFHFEELIKTAADGYQRRAYEALAEGYTAIFRNPAAADSWMHVYCEDQVTFYVQLDDEEKAGRWKEIASAIGRVIRGETELDKLIAAEIAEKKDDTTFLADEWRRLRKEGLEPVQIGYDLCHVWPG